MRTPLLTALSGILFGAGLALSDMINPARVLAFLDIAGAWDPTLAYVMAGAIIPSAIAFAKTKRMRRPMFETRFFVPENRAVDWRLLTGAVMFGLGWGLVGLCPGPAIAGLVLGIWQFWVFAAAMMAGIVLHRFLTAQRLYPTDGLPQQVDG